MALAPSWDTVAGPALRAPSVRPARPIRTIPVYPAGRHRGARTSWLRAFFSAILPAPRYVGRHRTGETMMGYAGRHRS